MSRRPGIGATCKPSYGRLRRRMQRAGAIMFVGLARRAPASIRTHRDGAWRTLRGPGDVDAPLPSRPEGERPALERSRGHRMVDRAAAMPADGGGQRTIGPSRGGRTTRGHVLADVLGRPGVTRSKPSDSPDVEAPGSERPHACPHEPVQGVEYAAPPRPASGTDRSKIVICSTYEAVVRPWPGDGRCGCLIGDATLTLPRHSPACPRCVPGTPAPPHALEACRGGAVT